MHINIYDNNSFSMLCQPLDEAEMYSTYSSPSSSPDCTLSLGTPSTRLGNDKRVSDKKRYGFGNWNIFKPKQTQSPTSANKNCSGDMMLARRCASCDTTSTPLWRNGPRGPKSLCNACGIRFKKEERRAAAAASTTTASSGAPPEHQYTINKSWAHQNSPKYSYSPTSANEFSFMDIAQHGDVDNGIPYLSWGLNVTDRPSFVHYLVDDNKI